MSNSLLQLKTLGQSVWYDNIDRGQMLSGLFQQLIDDDGISGATANPTIFEHSISNDTSYDEQMQELIRKGRSTEEIYEALVMADVRSVADMLRPIYEQTKRHDGYVSLEVSPDLAYDPWYDSRGAPLLENGRSSQSDDQDSGHSGWYPRHSANTLRGDQH